MQVAFDTTAVANPEDVRQKEILNAVLCETS